MAVQILRNLSQLKLDCRRLGLKVNVGEKERKEDYIKALREHFIDHLYRGNPPESLDLMLKIKSPMLCKRYPELSPTDQEKIWESKDWFLEKKIDGCRLLIIRTMDDIDFYSRHNSVETYLPISYKDNINLSKVDTTKIPIDFILDTEVISTNPNIGVLLSRKHGVYCDTQLQSTSSILSLSPEQAKEIQEEYPLKFYVFDILYWDGEWITDKPLLERRKYMKRAVNLLRSAGFIVDIPESRITNKKAFYRSILHSNEEGVVAKNIKSVYVADTSRRKDGWIKIKRSMGETLQIEGVSETLEAWVSGFIPATPGKEWENLVGALEFSVFLQDEKGNNTEHIIAAIAGFSMEERKSMTEIDSEGKVQLKKEYYGRVAEIDGQSISSRSLRLRHAVIVRWREDRSADTCVVDEEFIKSMVL